MVHRLHVLLFWAAFLIAACDGNKPIDARDRRAPRVVSVVPADGAADVPTESEVTVVFDEALRTQDFDLTSVQVIDADGNLAAGYLALNNDQIMFRASKPFAYATLYTVKLTNNIRDLFGNRAKPSQTTFTTVPDRQPPRPPYNLVYSPLTHLGTTLISGAKDPGTTLQLNDADVATSAASAMFQVTVPLPKEGPNTFKFVAIDGAGNESDANHISIERDQTAPAGLSLCAGATGLAWHAQGRNGCWVPPNPLYWSNAQLPIGGVWSPGTNEVAFVRLGNREDNFGSSAFEYDALSGGIPAGPVSLVIGARDLAGNETLALQRTFVFDASPPTLFLSADTSGAFGASSQAAAVTNVTSGQLTFTKGDDQTPTDVAYFATLDGAAKPACAAAASVCNVPFALAPGLHRFSISATDAAGNTTRIFKTLRVDVAAPSAVVVPIAGDTTGLSPTLHVFTQEPVTASTLTLTGPVSQGTLGVLTLAAIEEPATFRKHWSFTGSGLTAGSQTASVSLRDAAGNTTALTWNFEASGAPVTSVIAGYAGLITYGSRDGNFTIFGMPANAVNVVRLEQTHSGNSIDLYATTTTQVSAEAEPLSMLSGWVNSYNADGTATSFALPGVVWNEDSRMTGAFAAPSVASFPAYGSAVSLSGASVGFTLFSDAGEWFQVDEAGLELEGADNVNCSGGGRYPTYPLLKLSDTVALAGMDCFGASPTITQLTLADRTRSVLWTGPAEDTQFGTALASGDLFGDGKQTILVGSPIGTQGGHGTVYVYANAAATAPVMQLHGPGINAGQFGGSIALASNHLPATATLAAIAYNEAAIYFYDGATLRDALTPSLNNPIATYRMRSSLPSNQTNCPMVFAKNRQEVITPGDLDGDGSDDFVTASWSDDCPLTSYPYVEYQVSLRIFLGGPGASDGNPIVIWQTVSKRDPLSRPRLIALGDLDGDGLADFGYVDGPQNGLIRVFYGDPSGTPRQTLLRPFMNPAPLSWALAGMMDGNGDGYPDFILSRYDPGVDLQQMLWP